jgi:DNA-binding SARP family transcriptional activator
MTGESADHFGAAGATPSDAAPAVQFGVLGPLEVRSGESPLKVGPLKQRIALALLLCHANKVVSVATLSDALWGLDMPRTAHKNLQVYISLLRGILFPGAGADRVSYHFPGYRIQLDPPELDLLMFEHIVRAGRATIQRGDVAGGARTLRTALGLWRGTALADLSSLPLLDAEASRLDRLRASVYEDWAEAELVLGNHSIILDQIEEQVRRHPLRERLRRVQLLALARSGRQVEALAEYDELRVSLARDLGLEPSGALRQVYQAILAGEPDAHRPSAQADPRPPRWDVVAHVTQLPRGIDDFTAREAELGTLVSAMRGTGAGAARVGMVAGPPGVGKTALALRAGHQLRDVFSDGQLLISMRTPSGRPRSALDVLGQLLRMGGLENATPRRLEERAAVYRAFMAERSLLLILDDARDVAIVRWLLPGAGGSGVLVTTRRRTMPLEASVYVDVGPFTRDEAILFLSSLIGQGRALAEPDAAAFIVEQCGRLPFAVRVAGMKLRLQPDLPLTDFAERIGGEGMLDVLCIGELSVRACAAELSRELSASQRSALRRLAGLGGPDFSPEDVTAGLGLRRAEAEQLIDALLEVNAIRLAGYGRFAVPLLLRAYLSERSSEA